MRKIDAIKLIKEFKKWKGADVAILSARNKVFAGWIKGYNETILKLINDQPTVDEWIPVEKGLPKKKEEVLTTCQVESYDSRGKKHTLHKHRTVGWINHYGEWEVDAEHECGWGLGKNNKVLAWQPLPDEYRGDEE